MIYSWKLLLGPAGSPAALKDQISTPLPMGKTIIDVFSDFMSYLFDSAKKFIVACEKDGEHLWNSLSGNVELILTHPDGWDGPQQEKLRAAAVRANIVPDTPEGHARVRFVTEGEATLNFCAAHTNAGKNLKVCR